MLSFSFLSCFYFLKALFILISLEYSSSAFEAVFDVTDFCKSFIVFCLLLFLYITKSVTKDYYIVVLLFITIT